MPIEYNFDNNILNLISEPNETYTFGSSSEDYIRLTILNSSGVVNRFGEKTAVFYSNLVVTDDGTGAGQTETFINDSLVITVPRTPDGSQNLYYTKDVLNDFRIYKDSTGNHYIKINEILNEYNAPESRYTIRIDFLNQFNNFDEEENAFIINEISPSSKEMRLKLIDTTPITNESGIKNNFKNFLLNGHDNYPYDCVAYAGYGDAPITNFIFDDRTTGKDSQSIILKFNKSPVGGQWRKLTAVTIEREIISSQIQSIFYRSDIVSPETFDGLLKDDSFQIDYDNTQGPDEYQNYNDLTSSLSDLSVVGSVLSGSLSNYPNLNVDYNKFENHTFFGSAVSKLENFEEKIKKIDGYYNDISSSLFASGVTASFNPISGKGDSDALISYRTNLFTKIQNEIDSFTPYEEFLYFDGQSQTTSSAPSIGKNYSHRGRGAISGIDQSSEDITTFFPSKDGFKNVYMLATGSAGDSTTRMRIGKNTYRAEEKPFFGYSGSVYLSFLIKAETGSSAPFSDNPMVAHGYNQNTDGAMNNLKTPRDAFTKNFIARPKLANYKWNRYILSANQAYWIPNEDIGFDTAGTDTENEGLNASKKVVDGGNYIVVTGSLNQIGQRVQHPIDDSSFYSASIKAHSAYADLATVNQRAADEEGNNNTIGQFFTGSISPSGDLFAVHWITQNGIPKRVFITDVKVTTKNPENTDPFAQLYSIDSTEWLEWYNYHYQSAKEFDEYNIHSLENNLPKYIKDATSSNDLKRFLNMIGEHFDLIRNHIDNYQTLYKRNYDKLESVPNNLLPILIDNMGWNAIQPFSSSLDQYFGSSLSSVTNNETVESNTWRKTLNNLIYLYKSKGTMNAVRALLNIYGYPPDVLNINEYGGSSEEHNPAIITNDIESMTEGLESKTGNISFVKRKKKLYHYNFSKDSNRILNFDWWMNNAEPETIEFVYKHIKSTNTQEILKSSGGGNENLWDLRLKPKSNNTLISSFEFRLNNSFTGSDAIASNALSMSTNYVSMSDGQLWNVMLQRMTSSISGEGTQQYRLYSALQDKDKITSFNCISMSVSGGIVNTYITGAADSNYYANQNWQLSGSRVNTNNNNLVIGNTLTGSLSEFRTWDVALSASKFKQHTLNKFSVVGDDINAHKDNLIYHYRLNENWYSGSSAERTIYDANPKGPKSNPTKYDKDIPIAIQTGSRIYGYDFIDVYSFTLRTGADGQENNNKIIVNPHTPLVTNLRPDKSSTKLLFDKHSKKKRQSSAKLTLESSPQKFINDFFINNLSDYNIERFFGNPLDVYNSNYSELETFTKNLVNNYEIIIDNNKFIRAHENLYNTSIINAVKDILPARTTLSDESIGVTIKPTILEKPKVKHHKLSLDYGSPGINGLKEIIDVPSYIDFGPSVEKTKNTEINVEVKTDSNFKKTNDARIKIKSDLTSLYNPTKKASINVSNLKVSSIFDVSKDTHIKITNDVSSSVEPIKKAEFKIESNVDASKIGFEEVNIKIQKNISSSYDPTKKATLPIKAKITADNQENVTRLLPLSESLTLVSNLAIPISGSNDYINTHYKEPFRDLHSEWGTGDEDTHFISAKDKGSDGKNNTGHIDNRFTFRMIGDVEVVSGSKEMGVFTTDYTNMSQFYNREIIDKGNRLGFKYNSYMRSNFDEQDGRALGKTAYFFTASDGTITYPVNHHTNFEDNYTSVMHRGTQNENPGILKGKEWEDLSTGSFYRIKVGNTNNILKVNRK